MLKCRAGNITPLLKALQSFPNEEQGLPLLATSPFPDFTPTLLLAHCALPRWARCSPASGHLSLECPTVQKVSSLEIISLVSLPLLGLYSNFTFSGRTSYTSHLNHHHSNPRDPLPQQKCSFTLSPLLFLTIYHYHTFIYFTFLLLSHHETGDFIFFPFIFHCYKFQYLEQCLKFGQH